MFEGNVKKRSVNDPFPTTLWSVVRAAGRSTSTTSQDALEKLCSIYWYPLFVFARRKTSDPTVAQDLTQAFFVSILEKKVIEKANQSLGKFRAFLLVSFKNFISNECEKENSQKRGGGRTRLSFDMEDGEQRFQREFLTAARPEDDFERAWALTLLERVLVRLETEFADHRKEYFKELRAFISPDYRAESYAEVAGRLNVTESAIKVGVFRLRRRYRELLRDEIAQTLDQGDVDDEIRFLFSLFAKK